MDSIISQVDLQDKLDYLKLDLEDLPESLRESHSLNFNISRLNNDKEHRVYKFIPIDKIDILFTPCLREDTVKNKYSKAVPLYNFLDIDSNSEDAEDKELTLIKVLSRLSIPEIENISTTQKEFEKAEPFKVKFNKDLLWQIYYSEAVDRYFMLVCTEEDTFSEFFYLLKKKIEFSKKKIKTAPKIYVPVNYMNYSEQLLRKEDIIDLENYLWLFTKNWPSIYEVYNRSGEISLQIVGDTFVYDKVKSTYKVKITSKEEAIKFFKLLKALFIMQTEIKEHFNFITKIDSKNSLELHYEKSRITYDNITDFIRNEFKIAEENIKDINKSIVKLEKTLIDLKDKAKEKEEEYLVKQREISTYLEYKKTFIGKVKYFFKSGKINKKIKSERDLEENNSDNLQKEKNNKINVQIPEKDYYTIEDLITIYSLLEKGEKIEKALKQDTNALKLKLENLTSKVRNANLYIEEIDKHRKSIFDFWKFSNKDEKLSLEMGDELDGDKNSKNNLRKLFDFEMDFEALGKQMDIMQRKKFSREETDSIFIASTEILYLFNMLRYNDLNKQALEDALDLLKDEYSNEAESVGVESFDIFGSMTDDTRKVKYIGNKSHRENEKNKFKILNINKKIDVFDFTERMQILLNYLEVAMPKINSKYDLELYKLVPITDKIKENSFEMLDMSIEKELLNYQDNGEGALNLIKVNYKEGMPLIYYSNIIYYDNNNQTLPEGMDISSKVLIDTKKVELKLINKTKFRTNSYFAESNNLLLPKAKDIFVYEYEADFKENIIKEENKTFKELEEKTEEEFEEVAEENISQEETQEEFGLVDMDINEDIYDEDYEDDIKKNKKKEKSRKKKGKREKI